LLNFVQYYFYYGVSKRDLGTLRPACVPACRKF
jgi:hypothetical protein